MEQEIKELILNKFFKTDKYAGAKNIGENLLNDCETIVASTDNIFKNSHVGSFISVNRAEGFIDCTKYVLDRDGFIRSNEVQNTISENIDRLITQKSEINKSLEILNKYIYVETK